MMHTDHTQNPGSSASTGVPSSLRGSFPIALSAVPSRHKASDRQQLRGFWRPSAPSSQRRPERSEIRVLHTKCTRDKPKEAGQPCPVQTNCVSGPASASRHPQRYSSSSYNAKPQPAIARWPSERETSPRLLLPPSSTYSTCTTKPTAPPRTQS